ncbi:MAG: choice-of-anchor tandem repeat GloVer-containing protein [Candidatus Korobacteraceae bacterium]
MKHRKQHPFRGFRFNQSSVAAVALALFVLLTMSVAHAQTLTVLHNFTGPDGWNPVAALTMDRAGNLYSTTDVGGANNRGTVFKLSRAGSGWALTTLYSFTGEDDGGYVYGGVTFGPDGSLYGTTAYDGQYGHGVVYRLRPSPTRCKSALCPWEETVVHGFTGDSDGGNPGGGNLLFDQAGNFYGTTTVGGYGEGVVFKIAPSSGGWTESVLWEFYNTADGFNPFSGLISDSADNLYGTTSSGGSQGYFSGVVYELSPSGSGWTFQLLSSVEFPSTATCGGVVMDGKGNLFGTSGCDSLGDPGGVFELTPSHGGWTFNTLYKFSSPDGPDASPTLDAAGNVYGTSSGTGAYGYGEVFKLTPSNGGWIYTDLHDFTGGTDGAYPGGPVLLDAEGNLYGTTAYGGTGPCNIEQYNGCGVVWEITP